MTKLLLLNPPINFDDPNDYEVVKPPYGLAIISAVLKRSGYNVTLFDPQAYHHTRTQVLDYVKEIKPDLLGMGAFTFQIGTVISFCDDVKRYFPNIKIILGGPHVSAEYESTLRNHSSVDFVCIGEGENVMLQLMERLSKNESVCDINGLAFRNENGDLVINKTTQPVLDLNQLPFADWESLPIGNYWDSLATKKTYGTVFASRGCPYSCTFCGAVVTNGKKIRKRTPQNFVSELKFLYDRWGIDEFSFSDSTFNYDSKWVEQICDEILLQFNGKPPIWRCTARADRINFDTIKIMKKAGCVKFLMGIESADPVVLKLMKKGETIDVIKKGLELCRQADIRVDGSFILGMPGDTTESINKTIELARELCKDSRNVVGLTLATPLPGTELYRIATQEGLSVKDWTKFDSYQIAYVPPTMTKKELEKAYRRALRQIYFNVPYLSRRLLSINSFHQLKINIRYAGRIFMRGLRIASHKNAHIT